MTMIPIKTVWAITSKGQGQSVMLTLNKDVLPSGSVWYEASAEFADGYYLEDVFPTEREARTYLNGVWRNHEMAQEIR